MGDVLRHIMGVMCVGVIDMVCPMTCVIDGYSSITAVLFYRALEEWLRTHTHTHV